MRVPITHSLPKEEVRQRLRSRSHEIADAIPAAWPMWLQTGRTTIAWR